MEIDITEIESKYLSCFSRRENRASLPVLARIWAIGDLEILDRRLLGFFCSTRCSGNAILRTYDMVLALREAGVAVIGGFHSPMEKECLDLLLRGRQPVVICPARSIQRMRIPSVWRQPLAQQRLLIVSPFEANHRRVTTALAEQRNRFVAALASEVLVAYAGPGTKTARLCDELLASGQDIRVIDIPDHAQLVENGAVATRPDHLSDIVRKLTPI